MSPILSLTTLTLLLTPALSAIHTIRVGPDSSQRFDPEIVDAKNGDTLIFHLFPNHDVVESDFSSPCVPKQDGFYSGPYSGTDDGEKRFVVNVTTDGPHYWYCSVERHCMNGMVGGAGVPTEGETIEAYKEAAKAVTSAQTPGQMSGGMLVEEDDLEEMTRSASATASLTDASGTASESTATPTESSAAPSAASPSGAAGKVVLAKGSPSLLSLVLGIAGWML